MADHGETRVRKVNPRDVTCQKCGAQAGELCKRLTPGRYDHIDGVHQARKNAAALHSGRGTE